MAEAEARAPVPALLAVVVVTGVAVALLLLPELPGVDATLVANLTTLLTSAMAAGCAGWRASRATGRRRWAWTALSAALACWAVGETLWTWLQATGRQPFPSVADVAYLWFGPLACLGLVVLPIGEGRVGRLRVVLDGVSTSWALLLVSWETALGAAVLTSTAEDLPAAVVSIAYPLLDVVVTVVAVLAMARAPAGVGRGPLGLLAAGLVAISVADSAFVYLTATTGYDPGDPLDVCWNLGFGLLALAALLDRDAGSRRRAADEGGAPASSAAGFLPYVPVVGVLLVVTYLQLNGRVSTIWEQLGEHGLVLLLILRQYLTLHQNAQLTDSLRASQRDLEHQAYHDALTGLVNRKLFRSRLEHALDLHARDHRSVALLFMDLDDFKVVNDTLGHTVGDQLLVQIGQRMRGAARSSDTVARLGGDEFAVLLESGHDPRRCAERITRVLHDPFHVGGHTIRATASVGLVELAVGDTPEDADVLLARADIAMYAAKRSGKARIRRAVPADRS
jgi:diguanylate cyclase (GGDEF)-like protein